MQINLNKITIWFRSERSGNNPSPVFMVWGWGGGLKLDLKRGLCPGALFVLPRDAQLGACSCPGFAPMFWLAGLAGSWFGGRETGSKSRRKTTWFNHNNTPRQQHKNIFFKKDSGRGSRETHAHTCWTVTVGRGFNEHRGAQSPAKAHTSWAQYVYSLTHSSMFQFRLRGGRVYGWMVRWDEWEGNKIQSESCY